MRHFIPLATLTLILVASACSSDDSPTDTAVPDGDGTGVVAVSIEEVEGFFTEGFEVGFRFETTDGERIDALLWSDFVAEQGSNDLEAYYTSVLEQEVPAGDVVVLATANIGIGPPPDTPDLDGEMRCRLEVNVPAGGRVEVQVGFSDPATCLREL